MNLNKYIPNNLQCFMDFFRPLCQKSCDEVDPSISRLSHISAVGALMNHSGNLSTNDKRFLAHTIQNLLDAGVPISPDFEIDIINLKDNRDFLKETTPTDIIISCWVLNLPFFMKPIEFMSNDEGRSFDEAPCLYSDGSKETQEDYEDRILCSRFGIKASFKAAFPVNSWHKRAVLSGAKIIATIGGIVEVNSFHYGGGPYKKLLKTSEFKVIDNVKAPPRIENISDVFAVISDKDYSQSFAVLINEDYLQELEPCIKADNFLGKRMSATFTQPSLRGGA